MKYLIGVDVGGTKIECIAANFNGDVLNKISVPGGNPLITGVKNSAKNIFLIIKMCVNKKKINIKDIDAVVVGSTGMGRKNDTDKLSAELKKLLKINKIIVTTDAHIALEGAFPNKPGCILIAGTGSIIYGKDKKGNIKRAGGFGRLLGDFGSGYSMGRKGLIAVAKDLDGSGKKILLTKLLKNKFHIKNSDELISKVYQKNFPLQNFAPLVINAAEKKDKIAKNILKEEVDELLELIICLRKKMSLRKMKLSFAGSLISNKNYFSDILKRKIQKNLKFVEITSPENSPAFGAILLAKKFSGKR